MKELLKKGYIGHPDQLATVRRVTVASGRAKGMELIEVKTADGLEMDVLPDTGLDIGQVRYRGMNMSWMSRNGYDNPAVIMPCENEFMNTFPGGLLYTGGLRSTGPANRDNGEWHPLHGRIHSLAADQVCAEMTEDEIVIRGIVRETALFGQSLELRRTIRVPVFGSVITVEDTVTNCTFRDEESMILYHCNFGYPLLCEHARLVLPEARKVIPRTAFAEAGLDRQLTFDRPSPGEEERVFFQMMESEYWARLENPEIGVQMTISWSGDTLPVLSEWRSMASGDYALGLEPGNSYMMGRHEERNNGTLKSLKPFESLTNTVKIEFSAYEQQPSGNPV